jgi:ribosome maturation factor RimP
MLASNLSRSLALAGRPRLRLTSGGVGALRTVSGWAPRRDASAASARGVRAAARAWSPAAGAIGTSLRVDDVRFGADACLVSRLGARHAAAGRLRNMSAGAKKGKAGGKGGARESDDGAVAAPEDVGFDADFDDFAEDELMMTNEDGEAVGVGDEDIDADSDIFTAGTDWGETALATMRDTLADDEFEGELEIFSYKVSEPRRRIYISVDAINDKFGSPTLDQLSAVSRAFNEKLEAKGFPDDVALEVASPGAERKLRLPGDLTRFSELTMRVTYKDAEAEDGTTTKVLLMEECDEAAGTATWKLADVEENRPQAKKGQGMNKKQREWRATVAFEDVVRANLFIGL